MAAQERTGTAEPIVRQAGQGEALWFNNDLLTFKASAGEGAGELLVLEELARQGKTTPLHTHPAETERFYLLEGEARFHLDGDEILLGADGYVSVTPGSRTPTS